MRVFQKINRDELVALPEQWLVRDQVDTGPLAGLRRLIAHELRFVPHDLARLIELRLLVLIQSAAIREMAIARTKTNL